LKRQRAQNFCLQKMSVAKQWASFIQLVQSELLQQQSPAQISDVPNAAPPPTAPMAEESDDAKWNRERSAPHLQHVVERIVVVPQSLPVPAPAPAPIIINNVRERSRSPVRRSRRSGRRSRSSSPEQRSEEDKSKQGSSNNQTELSGVAAVAIGVVAVAGFSALVHQYYQDSGRLRKLEKLYRHCKFLLKEENVDQLSQEQRAFVKQVKKLVESIGSYQTRASRWKLFGIGSFAAGAAATLALPITWPFFAATALSVVGGVANYARFTYVESPENDEALADIRNNCARIAALPAPGGAPPQLAEVPAVAERLYDSMYPHSWQEQQQHQRMYPESIE
jgi:hypothetical protein